VFSPSREDCYAGVFFGRNRDAVTVGHHSARIGGDAFSGNDNADQIQRVSG
jgi:hypothetical protein